jgi:hypothetical protein
MMVCQDMVAQSTAGWDTIAGLVVGGGLALLVMWFTLRGH